MGLRIGELLVDRKILSPADRERALQHQLTTQRRLASTCLELGLADEKILAQALAYQTGVPFVVLSQSVIAGQALKQLPSDLARIPMPCYQASTALRYATCANKPKPPVTFQ